MGYHLNSRVVYFMVVDNFGVIDSFNHWTMIFERNPALATTIQSSSSSLMFISGEIPGLRTKLRQIIFSFGAGVHKNYPKTKRYFNSCILVCFHHAKGLKLINAKWSKFKTTIFTKWSKQDTTVKIIRQSFENTDLDCWAVCRTDVEEIPKLFFYQVSTDLRPTQAVRQCPSADACINSTLIFFSR